MMSEMVDASEMARAFSLNQISRLGASSIGTFLTSFLWELSYVGLPFFIYSSIMAFNIFYIKNSLETKNDYSSWSSLISSLTGISSV